MKTHKMNTNVILTYAMLALMAALYSINVSAAKTMVKSHPVGTKPESVIKAFDEKLFVSVMGGKTSGDGSIVKIIKDHKTETFANGLDEPKGMAFINNTLYVTDVNKIWEINEKGEKKIFIHKNEFPSPALYLNDLDANLQTDELYVTDMGAVSFMRNENGKLWPLEGAESLKIPNKGRIYAISRSTKAIGVVMDFNSDIRNPNGVSVNQDNGTLITGFFSGKVINIQNNQTTFLPGTFRGADQARYDSAGNIYISSWSQGKVWKLDKVTLKQHVLFEGLQSAADFILDEPANVLIIPDMLDGSLHYIPMSH
jgi:hypothetical protein